MFRILDFSVQHFLSKLWRPVPLSSMHIDLSSTSYNSWGHFHACATNYAYRQYDIMGKREWFRTGHSVCSPRTRKRNWVPRKHDAFSGYHRAPAAANQQLCEQWLSQIPLEIYTSCLFTIDGDYHLQQRGFLSNHGKRWDYVILKLNFTRLVYVYYCIWMHLNVRTMKRKPVWST